MEELVNRELAAIDKDYKNLETMLNIKPLKVITLPAGSFQRYYAEQLKAGADLEHLKPPHMNASDTVIETLVSSVKHEQQKGMNTYLLLPLIQTLFCLVLLAVVLKGNLHKITHRLFASFLFGLAIWGIAIYGMRSSQSLAQALFWEKWLPTLGMFISVVFYHFAIRYNDVRIKRWIIPSLYLFSLIYIPVVATDLIFRGMQIKSYGYAPIFGPMAPVHIIFIYILTIVALGTFIRNYKTLISAEDRNRSLYIITGMIISLVGGAFDILPILGLPLYPGFVIGTIIFCLLVTVAILKHNLLDIHIVLRKSTTYLLASAFIALSFVTITTFIIPEVNPPVWFLIVLPIVLALAFPSVWQIIQKWVDRLFYRGRYDYLRTLENFSRDTQSLTDSTELVSNMVNIIRWSIKSL